MTARQMEADLRIQETKRGQTIRWSSMEFERLKEFEGVRTYKWDE